VRRAAETIIQEFQAAGIVLDEEMWNLKRALDEYSFERKCKEICEQKRRETH